MIHMDDSESLKWLTGMILLNLKDLNSDSTLGFIVMTQIPPALTHSTEPAHIVKIRALNFCNDKQQVFQYNVIDQSFYIYKDLFNLTWGCLALNIKMGLILPQLFNEPIVFSSD